MTKFRIYLSAFLALLLGLVQAQTPIARQNFDNRDSWSYSSDIEFFSHQGINTQNDVYPADDGWADDGFYGVISLATASQLDFNGLSGNILATTDLDDEGDFGTSGDATITFASTDVSNYSSVQLSFDYDAQGINSSDELSYEVFEDGAGQGKVSLASGASAQGTETESISAGTQNVRLEIQFDQNGSGEYIAIDNLILEGTPNTTASVTISDNGAQVSAGNITEASTNHVLHRFELDISATNALLSGLDFTTTGSYTTADIDSLNLWRSDQTSFNSSTADNIATITNPATAGNLSITGLDELLVAGNQENFYLTASIPCGATSGNTIGIDALQSHHPQFSNTVNASGSATAAGDQTLSDLTPARVNNLSVTWSSQEVELSWGNPTCFDEVIIVASTSALSASPSGTYTASSTDFTDAGNPSLGSGTVVYNGSQSPQSITGLTNGTNYHFTLFVRNGSAWSMEEAIQASPTSAASTGTILITEIMYDPDDVSDSDGEYFELYNPGSTAIDLNGWNISDLGSNSHNIGSSLIIPANGFLVLGESTNQSINGGVTVNYQHTSFSLSNTTDEIILKDGSGVEIDRVEYGGTGWDDPTGAALIFTKGENQNNNDANNWTTATVAEGIDVDFGSPGSSGEGQNLDKLVFEGGSWTSTPDNNSGSKNAVVRSGSQGSLSSGATVNNLTIEAGATLNLGAHTLTVNDEAQIKADASGYAQVKGSISGSVSWESYQNDGTGWYNMAFPISGAQLSDITFTNNVFLQATGNNSSTNVFTYDAGAIGTDDSQGDWTPESNLSSALVGTGFSMYLGPPHFGSFPTTITATGNLPATNQTITIQPQATDPKDGEGWNFIGNPFACSIHWDDVVANSSNSDISGTYWIYDDANDQWVAYNALGAVPDSADVEGPAFIAPGQAFFVQSTDPNQNSITIETNDLDLTGTPDHLKKSSNPNSLTVVVKDLGTQSSDYTWIGFESGKTDNYDGRTDALKRFNDLSKFPALYTRGSTNDLIYNFIDDDFSYRRIPLYFEYQNDTNALEISAYFEYLKPGWSVYLEDKLRNNYVDLRAHDYTFSHSTGNPADRFVLHINKNTVALQESAQPDVYSYWQEKRLVLNLQGHPGKVDVELMDLQGRRIVRHEDIRSDIWSYDASGLASGMYILKVSREQRTLYKQKVTR